MNFGELEKYRSWLYSGGIAFVIVIWLASGQLGDNAAIPEGQFPAVANSIAAPQSKVRVRTQNAEEIVRTIIVNGKTAPARVVELSAETDGRVEFIGAERGANVDGNGLIVRLDERDRRARLAQAQATVKQREVEYEGRVRLKSDSYVSEAQLQEAVAQLEAARTELTRARLDLEYMTVRAPFDGALQARMVEIGDFVKIGDPIALFVDNRTIIVSAAVSEFDARYVDIDKSAEAKLATGERVRGKIRYVAPVADEATRTFTVELEIDNSEGKLRPGGTAELYIPAETVLAHRVSPSLLTLDDAGNIGVKIINDEGRVEFVSADIALASNDGVWLAGLPEAATIITVGQGFVSSGATVEAIAESDVETAVAIKAGDKTD
ncbi:MAG: efflux RND transporter periplasmic adaptor subunit [Gammaproteobacteria bacterium]|nr:efflux RND transporter periplasmic adaptor subunit [Gammaproteobacteria bacterium]